MRNIIKKSRRKNAIVSLNYHPGHYSHLQANYYLLQDCGYETVLFINAKFNKLVKNSLVKKINSIPLNSYCDYQLVIFWFPSFLNIFEILKFRILGSAKIVYVFHEPISSYYDFYKSGFNLLKLIRLFIVDIVNKLTVLFSSHIILPSNEAFNIYQNNYRNLNTSTSMVPLLFDDEFKYVCLNHHEKKYISYIGTIAPDHAFVNYFNFIEHALDNNLFQEYIFLIASGSNFPTELKSKLDKKRTNKRLVVVEGSWLSNEDINKFFSESILVWNAYDRSTQSGVLPKAFMFGAPVLGNALIPNEYIIQNYNGMYLENNSDVLEISNCVKKIIDNIDSYSKNSRDTFLTKFYYKNYIPDFINILNNE